MKNKEGTLLYNLASGRMCIAYTTDYKEELHCGDSFEVFLPDCGRWERTSVEMSWPEQEWFLAGLPDMMMIGARVRTKQPSSYY